MAARTEPRTSAFFSGLAALAVHAVSWGALQLVPVQGEAVRAQPPALVWLENPTVSTAKADTDVDARQSPRVGRFTEQPRLRSRGAARAACASAAAAPTPALEGLALAPAVATADEPASAAPGEPAAPATAAAAAGQAAGTASRPGASAPAPRAQLLTSSPCAGLFPGRAAADMGEVQVDVTVDASGHAALSSVLLERPAGQGFAQAAQACARKLLFAPAHDGRGAAVPVHAKLRLVFKRA